MPAPFTTRWGGEAVVYQAGIEGQGYLVVAEYDAQEGYDTHQRLCYCLELYSGRAVIQLDLQGAEKARFVALTYAHHIDPESGLHNYREVETWADVAQYLNNAFGGNCTGDHLERAWRLKTPVPKRADITAREMSQK